MHYLINNIVVTFTFNSPLTNKHDMLMNVFDIIYFWES